MLQLIVVVHLDCMKEHLFNLKFAAKGLERNAKKCEKDERDEKTKLKRVGFTPSALYTECVVHRVSCTPSELYIV